MTARSRRLPAALALGAALVAGGAVAHALSARPAALDRARPGSAVAFADGLQTATLSVERGAYRPNVVHVRSGVPLRLRVESRDPGACATRLLVPDLGVDLALRAGEVAVATVPAPRAGSYVFTCAERMVKGVLIVE